VCSTADKLLMELFELMQNEFLHVLYEHSLSVSNNSFSSKCTCQI
jgi:hypothetical protein